MKIYIATPVNGRKEATLEEKRKAAFERVKELEYEISKSVNGAEFAEYHSSFDPDIAPITIELTRKMDLPSEAVIMGKCVQRVMECDMILLDYNWRESKGCVIEQRTADVYGKELRQVQYEFVDDHFEIEIVEMPRVRIKGMKY